MNPYLIVIIIAAVIIAILTIREALRVFSKNYRESNEMLASEEFDRLRARITELEKPHVVLKKGSREGVWFLYSDGHDKLPPIVEPIVMSVDTFSDMRWRRIYDMEQSEYAGRRKALADAIRMVSEMSKNEKNPEVVSVLQKLFNILDMEWNRPSRAIMRTELDKVEKNNEN